MSLALREVVLFTSECAGANKKCSFQHLCSRKYFSFTTHTIKTINSQSALQLEGVNMQIICDSSATSQHAYTLSYETAFVQIHLCDFRHHLIAISVFNLLLCFNSGSDGTRDRKSNNSLLPTALGFRIFFVNLLIPQTNRIYRKGNK